MNGGPCSRAVWDRLILAMPDGQRVELPPPRRVFPSLPPIELVLVKDEHRAIGVLSEDEHRELEQAHDAGDIRAEDTLRLIREGRRNV